ncbi:MAG: N-acetylneuraminate synthase [Bacteroides sp.]|nr:N-acetylneuraminate synthase [Bacteroides sp.]
MTEHKNLPDTPRVMIIAEAGVNHNGCLERAREMVKAAAKAGADYVKFQTAVPELVISSIAPKAEYQKELTGDGESQLDMCRAIHLPLSDYAELKQLCAEEGIGFMSTPFDLVSIDCLAELGQDWMKIPSGEITNLPYLRKIAKAGIPVIISTGMSEMNEIEDALLILTGKHPDYPSESSLTRDDIIVLHCNTQYPTPYKDVNLRAMLSIRDRFGVRVGYSDHTQGLEVPVAAVAMGATVIEKHFTLDRNLPGPDHKASLEPDELAAMVSMIRNVEMASGNGDKHVSNSEAPNKSIARKSIVASRDIAKGEILTEENITVKRPGDGISPMMWDKVAGTPAIRDFRYDELIEI